jgi:hypothetical protein
MWKRRKVKKQKENEKRKVMKIKRRIKNKSNTFVFVFLHFRKTHFLNVYLSRWPILTADAGSVELSLEEGMGSCISSSVDFW